MLSVCFGGDELRRLKGGKTGLDCSSHNSDCKYFLKSNDRYHHPECVDVPKFVPSGELLGFVFAGMNAPETSANTGENKTQQSELSD
jgi:hypothetical protein